MKRSKYILAGMGVAVFTMALASFSAEKALNEEKKSGKKKYHIIHQKDGITYEYDTIIPMDSGYSVDAFLADKGIESEDVKIIDIPNIANVPFMQENGDQMRVFIQHRDENVTLEDIDGVQKEVKIIREENNDGELIIKKYVNGEEVEPSEEDMQRVQIERISPDENMQIFINEDGSNLVWEEDGSHEKLVELRVEMNDQGEMTVEKLVDGQKVDVSEEELQKIESGNGQINVFHQEDDINIDLDSILQDLEFDIEIIEGEDMQEGQKRIIVKEIQLDKTELDGDSKVITKEVRVHNNIELDGSKDDFTLVLVTENYDASMNETILVNAETLRSEKSDDIALNEPISVFPNPNNGTFTIAFEQKTEAKTSIRVTDAQGKIVFKEKLGNFSGNYRKELDLKKEGSGTYIVTVQQGDESSVSKVIVE